MLMLVLLLLVAVVSFVDGAPSIGSIQGQRAVTHNNSRSSNWFFYAEYYSFHEKHPCSTVKCEGTLTASISGYNSSLWMRFEPKPRTPFVVERWMGKPAPLWGVLAEEEESQGLSLSATASVTYAIDVPNIGSVSVDVRYSESVAGYSVTGRSLDYGNFQSTTPLLRWGLYGTHMFVLCYCPTDDNCPKIVCNGGDIN